MHLKVAEENYIESVVEGFQKCQVYITRYCININYRCSLSNIFLIFVEIFHIFYFVELKIIIRLTHCYEFFFIWWFV